MRGIGWTIDISVGVQALLCVGRWCGATGPEPCCGVVHTTSPRTQPLSSPFLVDLLGCWGITSLSMLFHRDFAATARIWASKPGIGHILSVACASQVQSDIPTFEQCVTEWANKQHTYLKEMHVRSHWTSLTLHIKTRNNMENMQSILAI